jgi:E3 ubiquitin-protein ligase HUWE1
MGILGLPNLPIDFPAHAACQAVAAVSKSILNLAHEPQVLRQGLLHLNEVLKNLENLHRPGNKICKYFTRIDFHFVFLLIT